MSDYALGVNDIARRLTDLSARTLVLAPVNSAIVAMPRKPWLGDASTASEKLLVNGQAYQTTKDEASAEKNIARFVADHIVPDYPIAVGSKVKTLSGHVLTLVVDDKDGSKYVEIADGRRYKVLSTKEASNGAIWVLDGVLQRNVNHDDVVRPRHDFL